MPAIVSVGINFVSAWQGCVAKKCRHLAVGSICRRHVGDIASQMAMVVFVISKPSSLVMLGTIFLYMREDSSKGTAKDNPTSVANLSGFIHVATKTKVPMGSKTFAKAMLSIRRAAKLEDTTTTTSLSIWFDLADIFLLLISSNISIEVKEFNSCTCHQKTDPSSCLQPPLTPCIFVIQIQDASVAFCAAITPLWPRQSLLQPPPPFAAIVIICHVTLIVASHCSLSLKTPTRNSIQFIYSVDTVYFYNLTIY